MISDTNKKQVPEDWKTSTLAQVANIVMGQSPKGSTCNTNSRGIPLLNGPTEYGTYSPTPVQFTDDPRKLAEKGDILFCVRGSTTGRMNWADQSYAIGRGVAALRHKEGADYQHFLRALIDFHLPSLLVAATGSTFPNVSKDQLRGLQIYLPPLLEQKAIAAVLSSLDDKIELLRRQNETLENIAQTIFREWFVEFNLPDKDGKPYKASGGKMVDSELGPIPRGWAIGVFSDFVDHLTETVSPFQSPSEEFRHYSIPAFDNDRRPSKELGRTILSNKFRVPCNVILVSKLNPKTPRIWVVLRSDVNSICSSEFQVMRPKTPSAFAFVDSFLRSEQVIRQLAGKAQGTSSSHQRVRPEDILGVPLAIPESSALNSFNDLIHPMLIKIDANLQQSWSLAKTRDALLPKLLSGELRVGG